MPGSGTHPTLPQRQGCPNSSVFARHTAYDLTQNSIFDFFSRFRGRQPFDPALLLFRPVLPLALYLERKDAHFALDRPPVLQALLIGKRADWSPAHGAKYAGLLECLACGGTMRWVTLLRPALRNDPAPRLPRGH